jgi:hypothetical protein
MADIIDFNSNKTKDGRTLAEHQAALIAALDAAKQAVADGKVTALAYTTVAPNGDVTTYHGSFDNMVPLMGGVSYLSWTINRVFDDQG